MPVHTYYQIPSYRRLKPAMQTVRYKPGMAVLAFLSAVLLFMQLCGTFCAVAGCLKTWAAQSAEQKRGSSHCHHTQPTVNQYLPEPLKKGPHSCADHEAAVMLPVRNLLSAVGSLHYPTVYETFTILLANQSVSDCISNWDSLRSPPRSPQRSVLRI